MELLGTALGQYQIVELIGEGGEGAVRGSGCAVGALEPGKDGTLVGRVADGRGKLFDPTQAVI